MILITQLNCALSFEGKWEMQVFLNIKENINKHPTVGHLACCYVLSVFPSGYLHQIQEGR